MSATPRSGRLYLQVLVGVVLGVLVGHFEPAWGVALKPLGDAFIALIKMLVAPIVFTTVVSGIARMTDLRQAGRVAGKALVYFEVVTTVALLIGLVVGKVIQPGASVHADPATLDASAVARYTTQAHPEAGWAGFLVRLIPESFMGAFTSGDVLQVLLLAVLVGVALAGMGERGVPVTDFIERFSAVLFRIVGGVMRLAPVGAFGAMAFTVGQHGLHTLSGLASLVLCFYLTSALFVGGGLALIARLAGVRLWPLLMYLSDEIFLVVGTSSSESALPRLMDKLERLGCRPAVVRLVVPLGYSFNLDGTSIYLTLATLFVAQATGTHLTLTEELGLLAVLLLTSKGAASVTGGGFITLAATLSATGQIPLAGLTLLLGVDRFMSEVRAVTNFIGNSVATLVVARWGRRARRCPGAAHPQSLWRRQALRHRFLDTTN